MAEEEPRTFEINFISLQTVSGSIGQANFSMNIFFQEYFYKLDFSSGGQKNNIIEINKRIKFDYRSKNDNFIRIILLQNDQDKQKTLGEAKVTVFETFENKINSVQMDYLNQEFGHLNFRFTWLTKNTSVAFDKVFTFKEIRFDYKEAITEMRKMMFEILCDQKIIYLTDNFKFDAKNYRISFGKIKLRVSGQSKMEIIARESVADPQELQYAKLKRNKIDEQENFIFRIVIPFRECKLDQLCRVHVFDCYENVIGKLFFLFEAIENESEPTQRKKTEIMFKMNDDNFLHPHGSINPMIQNEVMSSLNKFVSSYSLTQGPLLRSSSKSKPSLMQLASSQRKSLKSSTQVLCPISKTPTARSQEEVAEQNDLIMETKTKKSFKKISTKTSLCETTSLANLKTTQPSSPREEPIRITSKISVKKMDSYKSPKSQFPSRRISDVK